MKSRYRKFVAVLILICVLIGLYALGGRFFFGNFENTLIVYFSRVGNTDFSANVDAVSSASLRRNREAELVGNSEQIALSLQHYLGGELYRIEGVNKYPEDYDETVNQARAELSGNARPELDNHIENMERYDRIVLVYPIWWGTMPMPVFSFLEEYDLADKEIIPIATHKGSFLGSSVRDIHSLVPEANIRMGIPVSGSAAGYFEWMPIMLFGGIATILAGRTLCKSQYSNKRMKYVFHGMTLGGVFLVIFVAVRIII